MAILLEQSKYFVLQVEENHIKNKPNTYANKKKCYAWFSLGWTSDSFGSPSGSSVSDGCDSCLAAACTTRSRTAVDEGDNGRPIFFGSNIEALQENAWAPNRKGDSNNLKWNLKFDWMH